MASLTLMITGGFQAAITATDIPDGGRRKRRIPTQKNREGAGQSFPCGGFRAKNPPC
jgi:hypothetical protein